MGIFDSYEKKRFKEDLKEFERLEREYESVKMEEGRPAKDGGVICPFCNYEMSLIEYLEQWQTGGVRIINCLNCHKEFKTH